MGNFLKHNNLILCDGRIYDMENLKRLINNDEIVFEEMMEWVPDEDDEDYEYELERYTIFTEDGLSSEDLNTMLWLSRGHMFWHEDDDANQYLRKLIQRGLIVEDEMKISLEKRGTGILGQILESWGLNCKGPRPKLVTRIVENVPEEFIRKYIKNFRYRLTDKGEEVIRKNHYVVEVYDYKDAYIEVSAYNRFCKLTGNNLTDVRNNIELMLNLYKEKFGEEYERL